MKSSPVKNLLTQLEFFNQAVIAVHILPAQVAEKPSSLSYELEQAALGVVIMAVSHHVPRQLVDSLREQRIADAKAKKRRPKWYMLKVVFWCLLAALCFVMFMIGFWISKVV